MGSGGSVRGRRSPTGLGPERRSAAVMPVGAPAAKKLDVNGLAVWGATLAGPDPADPASKLMRPRSWLRRSAAAGLS